MRKVIKLICAIMILFTFAFVFVGCEKDNGSQKPDDPPQKHTEIYELNSYRVELKVNETYELKVLNEGTFDVDWESKAPNIATVSDSGEILAIAPGKTEISVNIEQTEEIIVTVLVLDNEGLIPKVNFTINSEISKIYTGYTKALTPKLVIGSETKDLKEYSIAYSSSDVDVVEIDVNGVITGKSVGQATITAKVTVEGADYVATTSVKVVSLCYVKTDKPEIILSKTGNFKKTERIIPELYRFEGNTAVKVEYLGEWEFVSSNRSVATVDDSGVVTAVGNGNATITVRCASENEETNVEINVYETYDVIRTPYDFNNIKNNMNGYYELYNDIDFEGISFVPFCLNSSDPASSTPFTGCLNGNGYSVKNITHASNNHLKSIFPVLGESGVIKDISFENVFIPSTGAARSAGLVWSNFGTIENVFVSVTTNGTGTAVNEWGFGGIVSANRGTGILVNSIVDLTDNSNSGFTGAVFNVNQGGMVSNNIAITNKQGISAYTHTGSFGATANNIVVNDLTEINNLVRTLGFDLTVWKINNVTLPSLIDNCAEIKYLEESMVKGSTKDIVIGTGVVSLYGYGASGEKIPVSYSVYSAGKNAGMNYIPGSFVSALSSGVNVFYMEQEDDTFTEIDLIVVTNYISNKSDFEAIKNELNGYYVMTADVDLGGITKQNGYITSFGGTLDGQGHKLTYSYADSHYIRLFETIAKGATIKNVWFNLTGTGSSNRAGQYGIAMTNNGTIENCFVDVTFLNVGQSAGTNLKSAMIQTNAGTIRNNIVRVNYTGTTGIEKGTNTIIGITSGGNGTVTNNMLIGLVTNATGTIEPFYFDLPSTNTATFTNVNDAISGFNSFVSNGFNKGTLWTNDTTGIYFNQMKVIG